jgi:hypothetical protein
MSWRKSLSPWRRKLAWPLTILTVVLSPFLAIIFVFLVIYLAAAALVQALVMILVCAVAILTLSLRPSRGA